MKKQTLKFTYKEQEIEFSFSPTEPEQWFGFRLNNLRFDVHYDQDNKTIYVYEIVEGYTNLDNSIYKQTI